MFSGNCYHQVANIVLHLLIKCLPRQSRDTKLDLSDLLTVKPARIRRCHAHISVAAAFMAGRIVAAC